MQRALEGFEPYQLQNQAKACTTTSLNLVWNRLLIIDFNNYFLYFYPKMFAKDFSSIWTGLIANCMKPKPVTLHHSVMFKKRMLIIDLIIVSFIFTPKWLQRALAGFEPHQLLTLPKACTTTSLHHLW